MLGQSQLLIFISLQLFLLAHEPLETSPLRAESLINAIRTTRKAHRELLLEKMKAPDGSYDADLVLPGTAGVGVKEWKRKNGSLSKSASSADLGTARGSVTPMTASAMAGIPPKPDASSNLELNNPLSLHNEVRFVSCTNDC
jgi:TBC1 domain family protein 5